MYSDLPHIAIARAPADVKIQLIKAWRRATGMGLKESKDKIDTLESDKLIYLYANEIGALTESDVWIVHDKLHAEGFGVELRHSVPPEARNLDPMRGVAHSAAVLAAVFAADEGSVEGALIKVKTLATVTQDQTVKAAVIILGEALDRIEGRVKGSLLTYDWPTA